MRANVSFAAIDKYVESNIVSPREQLVRGKEYIEWGEGNRYPDYLMSLYKGANTLHSIINGLTDYIVGNDVQANRAANTTGETMRELTRKIALDYAIYGGYALQAIRDRTGNVAELYHIDMRYLRTNKKQDVFWYSEDWGKRTKALVYPKYIQLDWAKLTDEQRNEHASSIIFYKSDHTQVYPFPLYGAQSSIIACELERLVGEYHINEVSNGFAATMFINFNNGVPEDDTKEEIEKDVLEKFTGTKNAGRVGLSWNEDKDHAVTLESVKVENYIDKYNSLQKYAEKQIYAAFRANPNLFGIPTENLGFNQEEYESAFKLFNRTIVQPIQTAIVETYVKVLGEGAVQIVPFEIESNNTHIVE